MHALKPAILWLPVVIFIAALISCAGGPAPQRTAKHVRKSIYYGNKGAELLNKGCYNRALHYFQEAHQRYAAADDLQGVAQSLDAIADIYYRLGDMPSALLVYDDAIAFYRDLNDTSGRVQVLSNKAATLIALNRLDEAAAAIDRADTMDPGGDHRALRLKTRALLHIKQKDFQTADGLLTQALASADESEPAVRGGIYFAMGHIALTEKRINQAEEAFSQSLEIDRMAAAYEDIAKDLQALGQCAVGEDNYVQAVNYFKRSAKIFALLRNRTKADEVVAQLKQSAARADADIQVTLHWIQQWLEDNKAVDLCN